MSKKHLATYITNRAISRDIAEFINEEGIPREDILTIVAGPNYQILYYYVEAVDITLKETPEHE